MGNADTFMLPRSPSSEIRLHSAHRYPCCDRRPFQVPESRLRDRLALLRQHDGARLDPGVPRLPAGNADGQPCRRACAQPAARRTPKPRFRIGVRGIDFGAGRAGEPRQRGAPRVATTLHSSAPKNSTWLTIFIQSMTASIAPSAPYALGLSPKKTA